MTEQLSIDNVHKVALDRFPEMYPAVERLYGSYYDLANEIPDAYPIFEDVFRDLLFDLLDLGGDDPLLPRIFSFVEEIAVSSDEDLLDLLRIAILTRMVIKPELLRAAWPRMGPKTRELTRTCADFKGATGNVPVDP